MPGPLVYVDCDRPGQFILSRREVEEAPMIPSIVLALAVQLAQERGSVNLLRSEVGPILISMVNTEGGRFWCISEAFGSTPRGVLRSANPFCSTPYTARFDALELLDGTWATVNDADGGGAWFLEYAVERQGLLSLPAEPRSTAPVAVRIHAADVGLPDGGFVRVRNLMRPSLFLHDGKPLILGSSQSNGAFMAEAFSWWAEPAAIAESGIEATFVGMGGDSRVMQYGNLYWITVRMLEAHQVLASHAPLRVYVGSDLSHWSAIEGPEGVDFGVYDAACSGGVMWVAGLVERGTAMRTELWRLDLLDRAWTCERIVMNPQEPVSVLVMPDGEAAHIVAISELGDVQKH